MRFPGRKVQSVFDHVRSANLDSGQFEAQVDQLSNIELRQLGRLFVGVEQAGGVDRTGEYITLLRRKCRP
jgi:hypothetical protein